MTEPNPTLYCSFCGQSQHEVDRLIAGPSTFICGECVALCGDILIEERAHQLAAGPLLDQLVKENEALRSRSRDLESALQILFLHLEKEMEAVLPEKDRKRVFAFHPMEQLAAINQELGLE